MGLFSFLQPVEHDIGNAVHGTLNFLKPVVPAAENFASTAQHIAGIPFAAAKTIPAAISGNQIALANANNQTNSDINSLVSLGQSIPRGVVQLRQSAAQAIDPNNPTAKDVPAQTSTLGKALLGDTPIQTLQNQAAATKAKTGSTAQAAGGAVLSFLSDVAGAKGGVESAVKVGEKGAAAGAVLSENAKPLNEVGAVPVVPGVGDASAPVNNPIISTQDLHALTQADNVKDVQKVLDGKVDPAITAKIAPAIVETKQPGAIDNLITNAINPDNNVHPEQVPVPPPSPELAQANAEAAKPPAETAPVESPTPATNERGYTTSQKNADQYSPELKAAISGDYHVAGDQEAVDNANKLIDKQGVDATHQQILEKLQSGQQATKQDIITGGTVVSHLDAQGRTAEAEALHQVLAEKGTTGGQASQAFGTLLRRSPEGLIYSAKNQITTAGGKVTPEVEQNLNNFKENIKNTAPGSPERQEGVQQLKEYVDKQVPASAKDKIFAVWRAGLLTGPQTVTKIVTSHAVHGALEDVSQNAVGAGIDKIVSLFSGQRALVASARGGATGLKQGVEAGKTLIVKGRDINPGSNAGELRQTINFGNSPAGKIFQKYVDTVGNFHGSLYKPFYGKAYAQSMYNQAIAAAKTAGVKGANKEDFIQNFIDNADSGVRNIAKKDAETYTFQQETALGNIASKIQKTGGILGKVIVPFTRIPSAIATDLFNYSPAGVAKTLIDGIKAARSEEGWTVQAQREFSQNLGRGLTGSAAIVPGAILFNKGLMTLEYPTDPKEQKLWQLEGKIPNAVKIGGQWRSLGSIGPGGSVLAVGGHIAQSLKAGNDIGSALISGFSGGARSIESQSYLQGVSGLLNAVNDPGRYAPNFFKSEAGSIIPTLLNTAAVATDKYTRQTNSPLDAIKSRIPGVRETLAPKVNALGQPVLSPETGIEKLLDPFQSSTARSSPLVDELQRLQDAGQGILPATIAKTTAFNSVKTKLTPEQTQALTKSTGEATLARWEKIISNPAYQHATDQQKSAVLKNAYSVVAAHQKTTFAKQNKVGRYSANYATNRKSAKANKKFVATGG